MNRYSLSIFLLLTLFSCKYSFKGISIPPDVNTFYVAPFKITTSNIDASITTEFTERLKDKILTESRLRYNDTEPDCEFLGTITTYRISSVAPKPGETTAFNRLDISVKVEFINSKDESQSFNQNFSYFNDFSSEENILNIQDELIANINDQLVEDIFNKAFTNW